MAEDIDWLPVLQKVFKDYGTQLRTSKVRRTLHLVSVGLSPGDRHNTELFATAGQEICC